MADHDETPPEPELLFTKEEWDTALPEFTRAMTAHLKQSRTPLFIDHGDFGEPWGSGSFVELQGRKYILTNEHVARVRGCSRQLGFRFDEQDQLPRVMGNLVEMTWPWDLALLPITRNCSIRD